ncbi:MAG: hypothetical protein V4589_11700 [Bacteroidota bacterium]
MTIYCIEEFKVEFEKLKNKKQYSDLESLVLDFFLDNTLDKIKTGDLLNGSTTVPFLKKRIPDAGGYRVYFLVIIKNENVYISYVHPKTGPMGGENVTSEHKKHIQKETYSCIVNKKLYELKKCPKKGTLLFVPYDESEKTKK